MNRLSQELSPYLLQHAHQKINWFAWSREAFDLAKSLDKPVFLSIGYATCHWCHVMSHESFDDDAIAQLMNEHFICIKLDREERPDIDHIYMTAVNAMTGSGGWPLNVFLTPDAKPFYGGTYFPPVARHGLMAFGDLLLAVHQAWVNNRPQLLTSAQDLIISLNQHMGQGAQSANEVGDNQLLKAYQHLSADFDHEHGGLNKSPKFPMGHVLWFLMRYYHYRRDPQALFMVEKTLTAMATGGIYDHIGGGFHRYSVDEFWHVPHFEKMLYDQAFLLRAYVECYQQTGQLFYAKTALGIARYVLREMTSAQGGFYCAQDADSEDHTGHHVEGAFYVFTSAEIITALGQEEGELFNRTFGVEAGGNVAVDPHGEFVGKNVLFRQELNQQDESRIDHAINKLLEWRNLRKKPLLDDKILADLNGLMIASMAFAGQVLDQPQLIHAAKQAADFVWTHMRESEQLMHRWRNGHLAHAATIDDYAYLAQGFLALYEITFEDSYLIKAQWLVDKLINDFTDPNGGFFMTAFSADDVIVRPKDLGDGAVASGNSIAAIVLVRLFALTGEERYQIILKDVFKGFGHLLSTRPSSLTGLWCAWMHMENGGMEVLCHGDPNKGEIAKMVKLLYKDFNPFVVVKAKLEAEVPCVYVCRQRVCHQPVTTLEDFQALIIS